MKQIDQILLNVTKLGIDTAPLIYFVEHHPKYLDLVRQFMRQVDMGGIMAYSSVITLTETLPYPKRLNQTDVEREYRQLLLNSRNFELLPIDATIAEHAAELRTRYTMRTPDALQIAAVLSVNCEAFLTNDKRLKQVTELRVIVLDDLL